MPRSASILVPLLLVLSLSAPPLRAQQATPERLQRDFDSVVVPFLKTHCLDCHSGEEPEARLDLSVYASIETVTRSHAAWKQILDRVAAGEMPPRDAQPQPTGAARDAVVAWIGAVRDVEARRSAGDPGRVLPRRLSNAEYNYSIRDLTGVDLRPTASFPVDPANEAGFDNSGESLAMSPGLLQKYIEAARGVADHVVLTPNGIDFAAHPVNTDTDRDKYCVNRIVRFYHEQPTDLADYFYAAWQQHREDKAVSDVASAAAVSPKYLTLILALLNDAEEGAWNSPTRVLRRSWKQLQDVNDAAVARATCSQMRDYVQSIRKRLKHGFPDITVPGSHVGSQPFVLWKNRQYVAHRRKYDPNALFAPDRADAAAEDSVPELVLPGPPAERMCYEEELARFCRLFPDAFYLSERGRDYVQDSKKQMGERGRLLSAGFHSMMGYFRDDQPLYDLILSAEQQQQIDRLWRELDFVTGAPSRQYEGFLWFERTDSRYMRDPVFDFARPENKASLTQPMIERLSERYLAKATDGGGGPVELEAIRHYFHNINRQIRWVETARRDAESVQLESVIAFAARAWRRTLTEAERRELHNFYQGARTDGQLPHREAIQDTLTFILMSPYFSYRADRDRAEDGRRRLTDFELASRLSYFLWSSTPDDELLELARAGKLHTPDVIRAQTRRMLRDERVRGLATEFGANWLGFRQFRQHNAVDRDRFPQFTNDLRSAMFEEPIRFLIDLAQNDRSVLELIDGRHTFVNRTLAEHYGLPVHQASDRATDGWWRVEDARAVGRGGLLPMAVFLTQNAPGLRTSPVKRGYWVVRRLLGERIPPPPPGVPDLPDDESTLGDLTLSQVLARHRENQACAVCHSRFDSLGLIFEGFGPVGERRERDLGGRVVSTTAVLPDGSQARGPIELQTYLRTQRSEEFLDHLCRQLLSYGLGRTLILPDELLIQEMRDRLAADQYRFAGLVETIVTSPQFLTKRGANE